jgi:acyl-ACP thioesterase
LRSDRGALVDAVSLWVQVDVSTGRPARLGDEFARIYGPAAAGRQVSSKLRLPSRPPDGATADGAWGFRRTDLDQFGHVNNAAQLAVLEERLSRGSRRGTAEIEYLGPAEAGVAYEVVLDGDVRWLVPADPAERGSAPGAVTVLAWAGLG